MNAALETQNLTKKFGNFVAVNAVNISVATGEIFGLLGRNGAGKTTLIKMLTTLLPATSGTASINGYDISGQPSQVRRMLGYVPQGLSADGELTGYENLRLFASLYDIPSREIAPRIKQSLAFMGLADAAEALVKTYSGGMIRRLEIAQSMLHRPPLLFLDEPTIGLDPVAREAVWSHIIQLQREFGTTIFLTTHYMEEAETLCNRIAIMRRGNIVTDGTIESLKQSSGLDTLDEIFAYYTSDAADNELTEDKTGYAETSSIRRTARRLS
jgi:ABC-2 type transport system ATP-binding protein